MRLRIALSGVAVAAITLTGCSSGSDAEPESSPTPSMEQSTEAEGGTVVDVAAANPDFTTLVAAVDAAGLNETLSGTGPFTVFAPTDEAFAALGQDTIDLLLLPSNEAALQSILTYHVLPAEVPSDEVTAGDVTTVNGDPLTITVDGQTVMVNDATVTAVDVEASNGVIHVIDKVLLPPGFDPASLATE